MTMRRPEANARLEARLERLERLARHVMNDLGDVVSVIHRLRQDLARGYVAGVEADRAGEGGRDTQKNEHSSGTFLERSDDTQKGD